MTEHQHFNSGSDPVRLLCAFPATYLNLGVGGIEQLEDAPEFHE